MQVQADFRQAEAFRAKLDEAAGATLAKRLAVWPTALTLMQAMLVKNARLIQQRDELHGKVARFQKLKGLLGGTMTEPERDTMYLAAFELGEAILAPFGFDAGVVELRNQISVRETTRRNLDQQEIAQFRTVCTKLAGMLPWSVQIKVNLDTLGDEDANTFWDGNSRTLTYSVEHMRTVIKNLQEQGVYITLVGQVLAAMMAGTKPVADILSVLIVTAQLGVALGAKDTFLDRVGQRVPPDVYRGDARKLLCACWNEPQTVANLRALAPGADIERIFNMFCADAQEHKWKVVCNGPFLTVIAP